ncbi:MAG: cyclic-phosphate processing receiver domain-containing protein [Planctomycetota bacterium]
MPDGTVLILDDDRDRVERFTAVCDGLGLDYRVWTSAYRFAEEVAECVPSAALISLDHDLIDEQGDADVLGDGLIAAQALAELEPSCPVIVHTTNGFAAPEMMSLLAESGWQTVRLAPIGFDWIESDWRIEAARLVSA